MTTATSFKGLSMPDRTQLVMAALKRHPELDPQAVLAVFKQEGLSGGIGDGGHAFGPAQLNNAGGVITGKFAGQTPEQINEWAWSPAGIDYALQGISKVAAGQHGGRAVNSIVRNFERPADPNGEVQRALGGQVSQFGGGAAPQAPSAVGAPATDSRHAFATGLLGAISPTGQLNDPSALVAALQARRGSAQPFTGPQPATAQGGTRGLSSVGGVQVDSQIAPTLQQIIAQFGVHPTSGYRDPAHNASVGGASNSDHLRGDAVDFGGAPNALAALYKYAQGRFPYVEPMAQAKDHVHISFRR